MKDAIVIGGGPAGSQCALWLTKLGFSALLVEEHTIGGLQARSPFTNSWLAPVAAATPAAEVARTIEKNLVDQGVTIHRSRVERIYAHGGTFTLEIDASTGRMEADARAVVLACGTRPRRSGMEDSRIHAGLHEVGQDPGNGRIAILGGGDAAFEAYAILKQKNPKVSIFARSLRARPSLREPVPKEDVHVGEFELNRPESHVTGNGQAYPFDRAYVLWGWEPCLPDLGEIEVSRGSSGGLLVYSDRMTSWPGLFAAGDLIDGVHPCVATALGSGSQAAKGVERWLNALAMKIR